MTSPQLSAVVADFNGNRQQLLDLLSSYPSAQTAVGAATIQMFIDWIAGGITVNQFAIERAVQELRIDDASDPLTVYKMARTLGNKLLRMRPGSVTVLLTNTNPALGLSIPAYTKFAIGSAQFFNRSPVLFLAGVATQSVVLTEGAEIAYPFTADGTDYQTLNAGVGTQFALSNDDLRLIVGGLEYTRVENGLWNYSATATVFRDGTLPDGSVQVQLGSGINGYKPTSGSSITVIAYRVGGPAINTSVTGTAVTASAFPAVTGTTTSGIQGAQGIPSLDAYRYNTPKVWAAAERCVTRPDFALLCGYPGVIDVRAVGEADVAPGDYRWNTTVGLVTLTNTVWDVPAQDAFLAAAAANKTVFGFNLIWITAVAVLYRPVITLVINDLYDATAVINSVTAAIQAFFAARLQPGVIGKTFYPGDLTAVIYSTPGVQHFSLSNTDAMAVSYKQYVALDPSMVITGAYA